jgi:putative Mn2+ efflux pump MntP
MITGAGSAVSFAAGSRFAANHRRIAQVAAGLVLTAIRAQILYTHMRAR